MRRRPAPVTPRLPYTEWHWPAPPPDRDPDPVPGFASFEHVLVPEVDPGPDTTYFWAHQFQLEGGQGGYLGLQTKGNRADGSLGKMAIFSLWDATGAEGPGVVRFGGEGTGWSARIPLLWQAGHRYRLRVEAEEESAEGRWWAAGVADLDSGQEEGIGRLRAAPGWHRLSSWSVMWTEYYGPPLRTCRDLASVSATFSVPRADGSVLPLRRHNRLGDGTCQTTRITDLGERVRHEMGLPAAGT